MFVWHGVYCILKFDSNMCQYRLLKLISSISFPYQVLEYPTLQHLWLFPGLINNSSSYCYLDLCLSLSIMLCIFASHHSEVSVQLIVPEHIAEDGWGGRGSFQSPRAEVRHSDRQWETSTNEEEIPQHGTRYAIQHHNKRSSQFISITESQANKQKDVRLHGHTQLDK